MCIQTFQYKSCVLNASGFSFLVTSRMVSKTRVKTVDRVFRELSRLRSLLARRDRRRLSKSLDKVFQFFPHRKRLDLDREGDLEISEFLDKVFQTCRPCRNPAVQTTTSHANATDRCARTRLEINSARTRRWIRTKRGGRVRNCRARNKKANIWRERGQFFRRHDTREARNANPSSLPKNTERRCCNTFSSLFESICWREPFAFRKIESSLPSARL